MEIADLVDTVRTGVISIEFLIGENTISSGSGFMVQGYLVTNNHVYNGPAKSVVRLTWQRSCEPNDKGEIQIAYHQFVASLVAGDPEANKDYAILDLEELRAENLYNFEVDSSRATRVGESVVVLGFPFGDINLACHGGLLSSFKVSNGVRILQVDASVNASNSGGPLLSSATGKVIGIVTRKATGLMNDFALFERAIFENIRQIQAMPRGASIMGVDPTAALEMGQRQIHHLCGNLIRSANVGIGYAFSIEYVEEEFSRIAQDI